MPPPAAEPRSAATAAEPAQRHRGANVVAMQHRSIRMIDDDQLEIPAFLRRQAN